MSSYRVLSQTGERLRDLFYDALRAHDLAGDKLKPETVSLSPPPQAGGGEPERKLSLWLYLVTVNEHLKNLLGLAGTGGVSFARRLG